MFRSEKFVKKWVEHAGWEIPTKEKKAVNQLLGDRVEALLYNVTSVTCALTLLKGTPKIHAENIRDVRHYIQASCIPGYAKKGGAQSGGTSMASDYFGYPHPSYSVHPNQGVTGVSQIRFEEGMARPPMGVQEGGSSAPRVAGIAASDAWARKFVRSILRIHEVKTSNASFDELLHMIDAHLHCATQDLREIVPLTPTKVERVFHKKKHAVFH